MPYHRPCCNTIYHLAWVLQIIVATVYAEQKPLPDRFSSGRTPFDDGFGSFATRTLEDWNVPGLSIAVIDDDQVFAEARPHDAPI
jgi:hypothetical protein